MSARGVHIADGADSVSNNVAAKVLSDGVRVWNPIRRQGSHDRILLTSESAIGLVLGLPDFALPRKAPRKNFGPGVYIFVHVHSLNGKA